MATVNFSVPDEVKELFNATFAHKNKSAIIAELMLEAARRDTKEPVSEEEIRKAREEGRP